MSSDSDLLMIASIPKEEGPRRSIPSWTFLVKGYLPVDEATCDDLFLSV
jgi:hypothetical protein